MEFLNFQLSMPKRLGVMSFNGSIDPLEALSWLAYVEKVLSESMDDDRVRIANFMLERNHRKW